MLERLTHDQFEPCVGQTFKATTVEPGSQDLELVEVKVIGDPIPGVTTRHGFSLVFRGARDVLLPQAMYSFENETLGSLEFMIVPLGPDEDHQRYEALFN